MIVEIFRISYLAGSGIDVITVPLASVIRVEVLKLVLGSGQLAVFGHPHEAVLVDVNGIVSIGVGKIDISDRTGIELRQLLPVPQ